MSLINTEVKPFTATAYQNGEFIEVTEESLKGQWSAVVFYPADFTFVCPTELEDLADNYAEFQRLGVEVYGVSTDTHFAHKAWHDTSDAIGKVNYPLIGDPTGTISRNFGVMIEEEGIALRGTFLVNPEGVIKTCEIHDNGIGRDAGVQPRAREPRYAPGWIVEVVVVRIDERHDVQKGAFVFQPVMISPEPTRQ